VSENKIRELTIDDIRPLVQPDYMTRGLEVFDQNLVSVTSRYGNKLFANVSGSGSNPYRVSVIFDQQIKAKCTCPAARRTPFANRRGNRQRSVQWQSGQNRTELTSQSGSSRDASCDGEV